MTKKKKKTTTTQRMVTENVGSFSPWEFDGSFDQIREMLQRLEADNPQYTTLLIDFDYEYDAYSGRERYTVINVSGQRPENGRRAAANRQSLEASAKAYRKAQFDKLKEEFGG